jgi:DNA-binding HxlR family transcriptional regulator
MSPTVLNQRLHQLRETDIVELAESGGYTLSRSGTKLLDAMTPLLQWSSDWQKALLLKDSEARK